MTTNSNANAARKDLLSALKKLEQVRLYVADCRIEAESRLPLDIDPGEIAETRQKTMQQLIDGWKLEDDLQIALLGFYAGFKNVYTDWQIARSIDGDVPIWEETRE